MNMGIWVLIMALNGSAVSDTDFAADPKDAEIKEILEALTND